mmetsp:Transcript_5573/g.15559  ORF Transcript_5573/g.15559 Transcript_5573/m.15559 type:complete len:106 (-) Transcript_5573:352-669(-)
MQVDMWTKKFDLQSKKCSEADMEKTKALLRGPVIAAEGRDAQQAWLRKRDTKMWRDLQHQIKTIRETGQQMKLDMVIDRVDTAVLKKVFGDLVEKRLGADVDMTS